MLKRCSVTHLIQQCKFVEIHLFEIARPRYQHFTDPLAVIYYILRES